MFRALVDRFFIRSLMCMIDDPGGGIGGGGGGGATGTGSGSGPSSGGGTGGSPSQSGAQPGSPSGTGGAGTGSPSGSPGQVNGTIDWATAPAQLRTAYEELKAKYEPWSKLGVEHDVASTYVTSTREMIGEAYKHGRTLGYSDQDIQGALQKDLVGTLSFLRATAARQSGSQPGQGQGGRPGQGQIDPAVQRLIDQRLSPIEEHTNAAMADAANHAFTGEFDRLFADHYKTGAATMPKEIKELLFDAVSEMFKYNDKGMHSLKFARDVSAVAETFRQVVPRFEAAFNAYHMQQLGKSGQGAGAGAGAGAGSGGGQPGNQNKSPWEGLTLDDIATGDDRAVKLIPSMR